MPYQQTRDMLACTAVNLLIRDILNPGDTAFDVGAYAGWLTALMGRLVGPTGHVVAFEADPANLESCRSFIQNCGAANCTLVGAAVCDRVGTTPFFQNNVHFGSTLRPTEGTTAIEVPALSLDAYTRANQLNPQLIKVDVEGAELSVLLGAADYIQWQLPVLILEQQPNDQECAEFLASSGYIGIDAADYTRFNGRRYANEVAVLDVLYFRPGTLTEAMFAPQPILVMDAPKIAHADNIFSAEAVTLAAGRYVMHVDFDPGPHHGLVSQRLFANGRAISRDDGQKQWIWRSYRNIPFHLHTRSEVSLQYHAIDPGALDGLVLKKLSVSAYPGLNRPLKINELA